MPILYRKVRTAQGGDRLGITPADGKTDKKKKKAAITTKANAQTPTRRTKKPSIEFISSRSVRSKRHTNKIVKPQTMQHSGKINYKKISKSITTKSNSVISASNTPNRKTKKQDTSPNNSKSIRTRRHINKLKKPTTFQNSGKLTGTKVKENVIKLTDKQIYEQNRRPYNTAKSNYEISTQMAKEDAAKKGDSPAMVQAKKMEAKAKAARLKKAKEAAAAKANKPSDTARKRWWKK